MWKDPGGGEVGVGDDPGERPTQGPAQQPLPGGAQHGQQAHQAQQITYRTILKKKKQNI